jgi:hypothetical protein
MNEVEPAPPVDGAREQQLRPHRLARCPTVLPGGCGRGGARCPAASAPWPGSLRACCTRRTARRHSSDRRHRWHRLVRCPGASRVRAVAAATAPLRQLVGAHDRIGGVRRHVRGVHVGDPPRHQRGYQPAARRRPVEPYGQPQHSPRVASRAGVHRWMSRATVSAPQRARAVNGGDGRRLRGSAAATRPRDRARHASPGRPRPASPQECDLLRYNRNARRSVSASSSSFASRSTDPWRAASTTQCRR